MKSELLIVLLLFMIATDGELEKRGIISVQGPERHVWDGPPGPEKHDGAPSEHALIEQELALLEIETMGHKTIPAPRNPSGINDDPGGAD